MSTAQFDFVVLYASETGTAEDVAYKLCADARKRHYNCLPINVAHFPTDKLANQKCVIFIVSTTGDGEMVADMKSFWKPLLRKKLTTSFLSMVNVAVFGLGDSGYDKFNAAARKLSVRLNQLGAREILPIGLGDDLATYGFYTAYSPWLFTLWKRLAADVFPERGGDAAEGVSASALNHPPTAPIDITSETGDQSSFPPPAPSSQDASNSCYRTVEAALLPQQYRISIVSAGAQGHQLHRHRELQAQHPLAAVLQSVHHPESIESSVCAGSMGGGSERIEAAKVVRNVALTSEKWAKVQEVRHIDIVLPNDKGDDAKDEVNVDVDGASAAEQRPSSPPHFVAGDVAAVYPGSNDDVIARLLVLMHSRPTLSSNTSFGGAETDASPAAASTRGGVATCGGEQLLEEAKRLWVTVQPTSDCPVTKTRLLGYANKSHLVEQLFYSNGSSSNSISSCSGSGSGKGEHLHPSVTCSVYHLLKFIINIQGIPRRSYFEFLSQFATDPEERDKLVELSSAEGTDLYYDYCIKESRNYVEILEDFKSVRMAADHCQGGESTGDSNNSSTAAAFDEGVMNRTRIIMFCSRLLETIPVLQPRLYSIASSGRVTGRHLHLCVGIVRHKTRYNRTRVGICSSYLSSLVPAEESAVTIHVSIRKGTYSAQHNSGTNSATCGKQPIPLILVGPGTGIAPIRGIVQERVLHARTSSSLSLSAPSLSCGVSSLTLSEPAVDTLVFYGCRKRDDDCLYKDEWLSMHNDIEGGNVMPAANGGNDSSDRIVAPEKRSIIATVAFSQERSVPLVPFRLPIMNATAAAMVGKLNDDNNSIPGDRDQNACNKTNSANVSETSSFANADAVPIVGKTYVTRKIRQYGSVVWKLIQNGAVILVAGSAKRMPKDVRKAIVDVVMAHGGTDALGVSAGASEAEQREAADNYVTMNLERRSRYVVEAWS